VAAGWYWKQRSGEGEAQRNGGKASGGPRAAIYREEEVWEGRKAENHDGGSGGGANSSGRRRQARGGTGMGRRTKG
jgi:hypothetical protein